MLDSTTGSNCTEGSGIISASSVIRIVAALLLLAAGACRAPGTVPATSPGEAGQGKPGGEIVLAAEQYPKCLNVITKCWVASWLHYTATIPTLPQLITLDGDNNYVASPLIRQIPTFENGGLTRDPFTVTYELNPDAVWEDGTPITGEDVRFTWQAYLKSAQSIYGKDPGYSKITDIEVKDNRVTLKFSGPYAAWRDKFGGGGEYVLKAAAFGGNPEVSDKMQTDLPFSGGPYKLQSYSDSEMVLVRNDRFWGRKALLERIVFRKIADTTAEINAFRTGEVAGFYPQPSVELVDQIEAIPGGVVKPKAGTVFEGLWMNLDKFPVNDRAVREALLYGLDRQAAIDVIVKPVDRTARVNPCLWNTPRIGGGKWCNADFPTKPDKARATQALEKAGWKRGADGIYAKDGQRLVIPLATTAGNKGREQFQQILQAQAKEIGIELTVDNSDSTTLFQKRMPARDFVMAMFAQVQTPDPTLTIQLGSDQIPTPESPDGQNYYGWRNPEADEIMRASDEEVDEAKRVELFRRLGRLMAADIISIPLYPKPQILVYNSNKLGGDFEFNAGQLGWGGVLGTWYLK